MRRSILLRVLPWLALLLAQFAAAQGVSNERILLGQSVGEMFQPIEASGSGFITSRGRSSSPACPMRSAALNPKERANTSLTYVIRPSRSWLKMKSGAFSARSR